MSILRPATIPYWLIILIVALNLATGFCDKAEALPVFPGAEGFGTDTRAAYGNSQNPTIFVVTDLTNDNGTPGVSTRNGSPVKTGSFREAVNYKADNKLIVFEVSGTIDCSSSPALQLYNNYVTIAGQTAPSPGVTIKGATLVIWGHDVLVQHVRLRLGDTAIGSRPFGSDGFSIYYNSYNVVIDHISCSWAIDENLGMSDNVAATGHDFTISNSIISEGLHNSLNPDGPHSMGILVGQQYKAVAIIRNLLAHNYDRNPLLKRGTESIVVNNVIYNGAFNAICPSDSGDPLKTTIVGNSIIPGPSSGGGFVYALKIFASNPDSGVYVLDNNCVHGAIDPWDNVINTSGNDIKVMYPPISLTGVTVSTASDSITHVLSTVGARPADRDSVDKRIINDVKNRTGRIIDSQKDVGGWPVLVQNTRSLGIPDNPHSDNDGDGYTNLEEWLHQFAEQVEGGPSPTQPIAPPKTLKVEEAK